MPPRTRYFLAVWPSPEVVNDLAAALPEGKWHPTKRWHVTVAFFGPREPDMTALPRLLGADLRLRGVGRFGSALWMGVQEDGWLSSIADICRRTFEIPEGPYRPHLTIARTRDRALPEALRRYLGPVWRPESLTSVRSTSDGGLRYEVIDHVPLAES